MQVSVVIPVYSQVLSNQEKHSLRQCLQVLRNHPVILATHKDLDTSHYQELFLEAGKPFRATFFEKTYFGSVFDYSRLLLSKTFYERFKQDDYILLYQLDGFVFRDELTAWCSKDYDYIGAPWLKNYGHGGDSGKYWKVGNGGVSLRKVSAFLSLFDRRFPLASAFFFIKSMRKDQFTEQALSTIRMCLEIVFRRPTVEKVLLKYTDRRVNEDCFWAEAFQHTPLALAIPGVQTGAEFCLEKKPAYGYELIGNRLPFCCHAYEKYDYESFWKKHIEKQ